MAWYVPPKRRPVPETGILWEMDRDEPSTVPRSKPLPVYLPCASYHGIVLFELPSESADYRLCWSFEGYLRAGPIHQKLALP